MCKPKQEIVTVQTSAPSNMHSIVNIGRSVADTQKLRNGTVLPLFIPSPPIDALSIWVLGASTKALPNLQDTLTPLLFGWQPIIFDRLPDTGGLVLSRPQASTACSVTRQNEAWLESKHYEYSYTQIILCHWTVPFNNITSYCKRYGCSQVHQ